MKNKELSDIAIVGLAVMGQNLARNIASHGYHVSVYNRSWDKTADFLGAFGKEAFAGVKTYKALTASLKRPRKVMIMVKAGDPVDAVISALLPHLQKGDIIIDGGNSFYRDTQRRFVALKKKGIHFIGCGVSGGEEGALNGPSLMPGGSKTAWRSVQGMLKKIAAKDFTGGPCVTYIGDNAAGHYVKMVHNGIEYGIMQLLAETYALLRHVYNLSASQIADIFERYNRGKLGSFLFEISVPVLRAKDEKAGQCCLIYNILDTAKQKGTGTWTAVDALNRGVAVPTIAQAVFARAISAEKDVRVKLNKKYPHKHTGKRLGLRAFTREVEDALYAASVNIFAQGFDLIQTAAAEERWDIDLSEVSRIWEGGCIIRAKLLNVFHEAYSRQKNQTQHVFLLPEIVPIMKRCAPRLRKLVSDATGTGIALPGFASSLFYFESMIEQRLPANYIQGLRDYFGAHTYERIDMKGVFHTDWDTTT